MHLIVDPVHLTFVQSLDNTILTLFLPLVVVFNQLHQIALLEITTHPVFLAHITQYTISLKNTRLELTNIKVTILKPLLPKTIQLRVYHVPTLNHLQLKIILTSMSFRIISSVTAPEHKSKT